MSNILSFEQEFTKCNPDKPYIVRHLRKALNVDEVQWSMITALNLSRFQDYCTDNFTGNTPSTYLSQLKAFLERYREEDLFPCKNPAKELKAKRVPSQNVFLTEEEIERVENYVPKSDTERDIKAAFLIECYCGARSIDVRNFTSENIIGDRLRYVSIKTKVESSIPIHRNLMRWLRYKPTAEHDRSVYNRTIKRICKNCGITQETKIFYHGYTQTLPKYMFVGSHTARRSFASNLTLRGVPRPIITALMNHGQNEAMTSRYICVDTESLDDGTMAFFS